jgi:hypothetical protein
MAGRKSLKDELKMFDRYSELSVPYFAVLKKHLESKNTANEKWAVEQLTKAFTKMIPTEVSGVDGKPIPILATLNVSTDNGNQENKPA